MKRIRRYLDFVGVSLAFVYMLPTLAFPVARDQAFWLYCGNEWIRGAIPYRDIYDFKPPGIFVVYAFAALVGGYHQWTIRAIEMLTVLAMGWVLARAVQRDGPRARGELGAAVLLVAVFYYGTFTFADVAQTEVFEGLALLWSYAVACNTKNVTRAALVSGVLIGVAVIFKFTAPVVGIVSTLVVAARAAQQAGGARRGRAFAALRAALLNGAGAAAVVVLSALYFGIFGSFRAMVELLFWHLLDYHRAIVVPPGWASSCIRGYFLGNRWVIAFVIVWALGLASAVHRRAWVVVRGALVAMALFILSFANVAVQRRYAGYYWEITTPFVTLCAAYGVAELARRAPRAAFPAFLAGMLAASVTFVPMCLDARTWWRVARYVSGRMDRWTYLEPFRGNGFDYRSQEKLGLLIRSRERPNDQIVVRGYEALIYVITELRAPTRFAVNVPMIFGGLTYKVAEWQKEYDDAIWSKRPRFIVTFARDAKDSGNIAAHRYHVIADDGYQRVFERDE